MPYNPRDKPAELLQTTRMKTITTLLLAAVALFLAGCIVTSVYPFYTDKDLVFDPALLGHFTKTDDASDHWTFEKNGTNTYSLTYVSDNKTNLMQARLFKLRGEKFLDLFNPKDELEQLPPPIPSHLLLRVLQTQPGLRMAALKHDWLQNLLQQQPKALRHEFLKDEKGEIARVVLTAETPELQKFVIQHLKTAQAWEDPFDLKKD